MIGLGGMALCSIFMTISLLLKVSALCVKEREGRGRGEVTGDSVTRNLSEVGDHKVTCPEF